MAQLSRRLSPAVFLAALAAWLAPGAAFACRCLPPPPPAEALGESDLVFHGFVLAIEPVDEWSIRVELQVLQTWKGPADQDTIQVHTANNGAACGVFFEEPREYLVYAFSSEGRFHTNSCTRTKPYDASEAAELDAAVASAAFTRGDANADGGLDIADAVFAVGFLFLGGPKPPCLDAADSDDTGVLDLTDAIYVLNWSFLGGPRPPEPLPDCGPDPSGDALGCDAFPPCP